MRPPIVRAFLFSLLLATTALGQALTFGEPFPLTNTRYGEASGRGRLASDGRTPMLFWATDRHIRAAKLIEGERRGGRAIFETWEIGDNFDAVWTGESYLVAGLVRPLLFGGYTIEGRLLDANGEPLGAQFPIVSDAHTPKLAANGGTVLLVYRHAPNPSLRFAALANNGVVKRVPETLTIPEANALSWDVASNGDGFAAVVTTPAEARVYRFDAEGQLEGEEVLSTLPRGASAIASNGGDYLVTTATPDGVFANRVTPAGEVSPSLMIEIPAPVTLSAVWSGSSWVVGAGTINGVEHFIYIDAAVQQTIGSEEPVEGRSESLVEAGGTVIASWRSKTDSTTRTSVLPGVDPEGETATHAAGNQTVLASATSATGTLVVWRDETDLETTYRAGIRSRDGDWSERLLTDAPAEEFPVAAASNGTDFVVVLKPADESEMVAFRLDSRGRTIGVTRLPFFAQAVTARGTDYVLARGDGALQLATLSSSGVVSPAVTYPENSGLNLQLAVSGSHTMVTWIELDCPILCPDISGNAFMRQFDATLSPIGEARLLDGDSIVSQAAVAADGTSFVIGWPSQSGISIARVTAGSNAAPAITALATGEAFGDLEVVRTAQGIAYGWQSVTETGWMQNITLVTNGGTQTYELFLERSPIRYADLPATILTTLANGDIALLASVPNVEAPHHGSLRVMMTIGTFAGLQPPGEAPQLSVMRDGTRNRLVWTAPPLPVNGYRIEYRIGDGSWNEFNEWYGPTELTEILSSNSRPVAYRIRAFTDGGASEYSNVVYTGVPKRRSVR